LLCAPKTYTIEYSSLWQKNNPINTAHTSFEQDVYSSAGKYLSTIENTTTFNRLIYRHTFKKKLEYSVDIPWYVERSQSIQPAKGKSRYAYNNKGGVGDIAVGLSYQWLNSQKNSWSLTSAVEVKAPTGNQERGLGTDSWEIMVRSALLKKTRLGKPYMIVNYNVSNHGSNNGVSIDPGDDFYIGAGWRSSLKDGFGFDVRGLYQCMTSETVRQSSGKPVREETYGLPGFQVMGRYSRRKVEIGLMHKVQFPQQHTYLLDNKTYLRDPKRREYTAFIIRYRW